MQIYRTVSEKLAIFQMEGFRLSRLEPVLIIEIISLAGTVGAISRVNSEIGQPAEGPTKIHLK
jgi:hypothetical protein